MRAFDLIGGTSTGAIIATALALGHGGQKSAISICGLGPRVFRWPALRLPGWQAKFDAEALRREIVGHRRRPHARQRPICRPASA